MTKGAAVATTPVQRMNRVFSRGVRSITNAPSAGKNVITQVTHVLLLQ
jgi:hypothetical protein